MKIGLSKNPEKRLKQLQTGNPYKLKIEGKIKCKSEKHAREVERTAHEYFSKHSLRGEWFRITDFIRCKVWEFDSAPCGPQDR